MDDLLFVGNGLAVLIAAVEAARRGQRVTVLADGRAPGGHFAGMTVDGLRFDIGMVMLEMLAPRSPCDQLASYDPGRRHDWTRFGHLASRWLQDRLPLRRVPTPECRVEGRFHPDYLIANRLDAFAGADVAPPDALPVDDPRHASHKLDGAGYDTLSYAAAAAANHGPALQARFIEPFVRKLAGVGSEDLLARQHRAVWAPLYYPETLRAALSNRPHRLSEYPFWTTDTGCVATLVDHLVAELKTRATLVTDPLEHLEVRRQGWTAVARDGRSWQAQRIVLGCAADRACALLGLPTPAAVPSASVTVLLASVPTAAAGRPTACLSVVDADYATCRITSPDVMAGRDPGMLRCAIEAHPDHLAGRPAEETLVSELRALWQIDTAAPVTVHRCLTARNALVLPTTAAVESAHRTAQAIAEAAPGACLTGALLGYGVASLNDQIVQALHVSQAIAS